MFNQCVLEIQVSDKLNQYRGEAKAQDQKKAKLLFKGVKTLNQLFLAAQFSLKQLIQVSKA